MMKIVPLYDASTHRAIAEWVEKSDDAGNSWLEQVVEPIPPGESRRGRRDAAMPEALNILSRHRNQKDYGLPPTLSDEQATAWAVYLQGLRDYPETGAWPDKPE